MNNVTYSEMREALALHFEGRWESILPTLCSDSRLDTLFANNRNVECPSCNRKSKFYMRDTNTARCHCCHPECKFCTYDGIALAKELGGYSSEIDVCNQLRRDFASELSSNPIFAKDKSRSFKQAKFSHKPSTVAVNKPAVKKLNEKALKSHKKLLNEIIAFDSPDAELARKYIVSRGLDVNYLMSHMKDRLFFHPNLYYYHVDEDESGEDLITKGFYPAIIAKIFGYDGNLVGFHRIYLDKESGKKANVPEAKLLVPPLYEDNYAKEGCVIPLSDAGEELGICEGIETALAVNQMKHPCWSLVDAYKLPNFQPPQGVKVLNVFGDLDKSFTGQKVMIKLFNNLKRSRPEIKVNLLLPPNHLWDKDETPKGIDFLDAFGKGYQLPREYQIL
tara:strand:- start:43716 stop:44888 length:1173 start_codon:yes stop_codon:yes gene_type:complete